MICISQRCFLAISQILLMLVQSFFRCRLLCTLNHHINRNLVTFCCNSLEAYVEESCVYQINCVKKCFSENFLRSKLSHGIFMIRFLTKTKLTLGSSGIVCGTCRSETNTHVSRVDIDGLSTLFQAVAFSSALSVS